MPVTALIAGGIGAASSIGGALIQSNAAGNAADVQANSANYAAQLQAQEAANALAFQQKQWETAQSNIAPYLASGRNALSALDYGLGIPGFSSSTPTGQPPTTAVPPTGGSMAPAGGPTGIPSPTVPRQNMLAGDGRISRTVGPSTAGMGGGTGVPLGGTRLPPVSTGAGTNAPSTGPVIGSTLNPGGPFPGGIGAGAGAGQNMLAPTGYGALTQPWTQQFTPPTLAQAEQYPGYQFQLQQGEKALQQSAAAQGNLLTGNTARDVNSYAQGLAQNDYNNVYNQALGQYQQNYNIFENNQANQYNRLAAMAGLGQTSVNQLNSAGANAAGNVSNILLTTGAQQGQAAQNAGAARASGYVGGANALAGGISGVGSNISNMLLLQALLNQGGGGQVPDAAPLLPQLGY